MIFLFTKFNQNFICEQIRSLHRVKLRKNRFGIEIFPGGSRVQTWPPNFFIGVYDKIKILLLSTRLPSET